MPQPNFLAIILAALVPTMLGFIWYHKAVFGTVWSQASGLTEEDRKKANMAVIFGVSLLMSVLISYFLLFNVDGPGQEGTFDTFKHGVFHGTLLGIMITLPVITINGLFEMKSWKLILINAGFWIVSLALMGGIIDALNHWPNDMPGGM